jgi:hypothetical protein
VLWYDFADTSTITLSSTQISQITDKGSRGWTLTKSTTGPTQGTWSNGLPCCDWGTANHSNYLRNTSTTSTSFYDVYIVLDANYGSTFPNFSGLITGTTGSSWQVDGSSGGTGLFSDFNAVYLNNGSTNVVSGGVLPGINNRSLLRLKTINELTPVTSTAGFQIGMDRTNSGRGWGGLIGEVVAFSSVLSSENRTSLQAYLARKWDLTLV